MKKFGIILGFHEVLLVVVLCEVTLYLLVHDNLLHSRSLQEVVMILSPGLHEVVFYCKCWSSELYFFIYLFFCCTFCIYTISFVFLYLFTS